MPPLGVNELLNNPGLKGEVFGAGGADDEVYDSSIRFHHQTHRKHPSAMVIRKFENGKCTGVFSEATPC